VKIIITATKLEKEFRRLIHEYDNFYWATAWAGHTSKSFNDLLKNRSKIRNLIVGIHFYQTHPDFIHPFINDKCVHFMQQPEGTFHPKVYLFTNNENKWELIIGSANFTNNAFSINTEASLLVSNLDSNSVDTYQDVLSLIKKSFEEGKIFSARDLKNYRVIWQNQRQKINSLSGQYGNKKKTPRPIHEIAVMSRNWEEFIDEVVNKSLDGLERRLRAIEIANDLFSKVNHFNELTENERKFIAGLPNKMNVKGAEFWGYFGSMQGAGFFKNRIIENDENISKSLDQIPLSGQITKKHYQDFIKFFTRSFSGNYIATATRLLCMKRPEIFVCFDSKNRSALCKDFGIIQSNMDYERYWDDIVERIYDCEWWQNTNPKNPVEEKISQARAAFLDSLYYDD
jgi:hypothetical protein